MKAFAILAVTREDFKRACISMGATYDTIGQCWFRRSDGAHLVPCLPHNFAAHGYTFCGAGKTELFTVQEDIPSHRTLTAIVQSHMRE